MKLLDTWAYYTQKWLVLRTKEKANVSRCSVLKKWKVVQSGGLDYKATPAIRSSIKYGRVTTLLRQMSRNIYIYFST